MNIRLLYKITTAMTMYDSHIGPPPPSIREHPKGGPDVIAKAEAKRKRKADKRKREALK